MKKVKGKREQKEKRREKSWIILVILAISILLIFIFLPRSEWSVGADGRIWYPRERGSVKYETVSVEQGNCTVEKLVYGSKGANISAVFIHPNQTAPAVILIPGAGVDAEGMRGLGDLLCSNGYASLAITPRERAITQALMRRDLSSFIRGEEPIQHKMVYDVLRAFDLLRGRKEVDGKPIAVLGESMGGRFAIIAGALEPRIAGVIGISAFGDDAVNGTYHSEVERRFYLSIDPDTYVYQIFPRKLVMFHDVGDNVVPFERAELTYSKALEPKILYAINGTPPCHGFCDLMRENLTKELGEILHGP